MDSEHKPSGRPKLYSTKVEAKPIYLPVDSWKELMDEAWKARCSLSELIRRRLGIKPVAKK